MTGNFKAVMINVHNHILTITLNRQENRNALNDLMVNEILEILNKYKSQPEIKVLILTGTGTAFCAGADLKYLKDLLQKDIDAHHHDSRLLRDMFYALFTFPKPTIAAVNGPAIGGGCGLANVCDLVIASNEARFGYPEVKIGFVPALVSVFLISSIGIRRAKELLLTGRIITASEAYAYGLVNMIIDKPGELMSRALEIAEKFKLNAPSSLKISKEFCNKIIIHNIGDLLDEAASINAQSRLHENFREGVLSFLEKRNPEWFNGN